MNKNSAKTNVFLFHSCIRSFFPVLLGALFFAGPLRAQMEISVDSNHVETGNPFRFYVKLADNQGKPDSLDFGSWQEFLPTQNVVEQSEWEHEGAFYQKNFTALFFDADTIEFPPLALRLRNGQSIASSNTLKLIVYPTLSSDDLNDMAPIKDIHREEHRWTDYWPWMAGIAGILALIGAFYWYAHQKSKTKLQSRTIETPPHLLALKKLEALAKKQLISKGMVKEHYSELTYLLREYLEKRFSIPVLESTTDETLSQLQRTDFPEEWKNPIKTLLEQADLAKFAKIIPDASFYETSLNTTREIIQRTTVVQEDNPQP